AVVAFERRVAVPDEVDRLADHLADDVIRVVVAVRPRKDDDTELHWRISTRKSSMTGFERMSRAMRSSSACASSGERPSPSSISKYLPWRTSAMPVYPTVSMAWWMALPWGSRTPRFSVTKTSAFINPLSVARCPLFVVRLFNGQRTTDNELRR